ncbi:MAG: pyridoxal 5'-phosphate synthase glutaminase subunit PdxT [Armatimonadetes bacterium]|nr:pyridoxal 5'-phosphate synthase glutaminase subunit PdxT [Armatimonadota bacterium]
MALQGDFQKHVSALEACGVRAREVRTPGELEACGRLIIPGGESTTLGILLQKSGLDKAICGRAEQGMPVWGTCMGLILMAREIEGGDQFRLGLLDITVDRNAFGPQVNSFEADVQIKGLDEPFHAVFIRSPAVTRLGEGVEALAGVCRKVVAVRQGSLLGTAFHPELTCDRRMHAMFLEMPTDDRR